MTTPIYLDHAATALPRSPHAIAAATNAMNWGNAQRGIHAQAATASHHLNKARQHIARMVGVEQSHTVCFLCSATAALNQVLLGAKPRCVAIDPLAHNATYRPLMALAAQRGVHYWVLPHDPKGKIDLAQVKQQWVSGTDWLVLTHGSNVTGLIQPIEIVTLAQQLGARVLVDASQTAGVIDLADLACADGIAFGAHKGLRGLPGIGALIVNNNLPSLDPLIYGGTGGAAATAAMPSELPTRLEAGTLNFPGIAAFAAAAEDWLVNPAPWPISAADLTNAITAGGGVPLASDPQQSLPVVSFILPQAPVWESADILERCFGIQLRAGLHCAPLAHRTLGSFPEGALRVSSGSTTTVDDLVVLTQAIRTVCSRYGDLVYV